MGKRSLIDLRSAIVWGASAKHARGQKVGLDHILQDEDGKFQALTCCDPGSTIRLQLFTSRRSKTTTSEIMSTVALYTTSRTASRTPCVYPLPSSRVHTPTAQSGRCEMSDFGTTDKSPKAG